MPDTRGRHPSCSGTVLQGLPIHLNVHYWKINRKRFLGLSETKQTGSKLSKIRKYVGSPFSSEIIKLDISNAKIFYLK